MPSIAYFVSSHGFGHAARSAAIIDRLCALEPNLRVEVFTGTPDWFFEQSFGPSLRLGERIHLRPWTTDVGLVQKTALAEDLQASAAQLGRWLPLSANAVAEAAEAVRRSAAQLVVCDISPLGLAVARHLHLPSVLVENFTWSWIYRGYGAPELEPFVRHLDPLFHSPHLHLRTEPCCGPSQGDAEVLAPIARPSRRGRREVRGSLGLDGDAPLVLVTMGGVPWAFDHLDRHLEARADRLGDLHLVVAGGADRITRRGRHLLIPHRSELYHPDLVNAADAVVGKLGYSTVAEVAQAGARLGYIPRPRFPESPELESWVEKHLSCRRVEPDELVDGAWLDHLADLLRRPRRPPLGGGGEQAARRILDLLRA